MRSFVLKKTSTYPIYVLIVHSNSFGDQIIKVRFEDFDGMQKDIWTELNHEGSHRDITQGFVKYMKQQVKMRLIK